MDAKVRALFEAAKERQDVQADRLDALEDKHAEIMAVFSRKDGTPYTTTESVMALDQRMKMKEGELMNLWGEIWDLKNEIRTVHYLITGAGKYGVRQPRSMKRPGDEGPSPYDATNDQ
jgi:hypothetical protein